MLFEFACYSCDLRSTYSYPLLQGELVVVKHTKKKDLRISRKILIEVKQVHVTIDTVVSFMDVPTVLKYFRLFLGQPSLHTIVKEGASCCGVCIRPACHATRWSEKIVFCLV